MALFSTQWQNVKAIDALTPKVSRELVAHYCSIEDAMVSRKEITIISLDATKSDINPA